MNCYPIMNALYMMKHFSFVDALNFLSFALAFDSLIRICLAVSPIWVYYS